jgi:hypothetical protein
VLRSLQYLVERVSIFILGALLTPVSKFLRRGEEEPQQVSFGKSTGVFSHKRARSTRIRGSASKLD